MSVKLEISNLSKPHQFHELKSLLDLHRLYRQGTDPRYYLDLEDRSHAHLLAANLEVAGYKVRVL